MRRLMRRKRIPFKHGAEIPVCGRVLKLHHVVDTWGHSGMVDDQLVITCQPEFFSRRVWDYLKKTLYQQIRPLVDEKAGRLGVSPRRVTLRDTSSRWGSCSSTGNLSFAIRLVFTPVEVIDYLVAHEVAHLKEMNHSPAFWQQVALLCPDYKRYNAWLKEHGATVHLYG